MMVDFSIIGTPATGGDATGIYADQADIENVFGEENVKKWSNLDNSADSANTTRIGEGLTWADSFINDSFRESRWALPLALGGTTPAVVKDWAAKLAGIWLYQNRGTRDTNDEGTKYQDMEDDVKADIQMYTAGVRTFAADVGDTHATAPSVVRK